MTLMWDEIHEQPDVLEKCISYNVNTLRELAGTIVKNEITSVIIAARGTSDHAGIYGKYIIEHTLGLPVALAAPSIFTVYGKELKLKNSLVIGISQSGKAADVLEVIKAGNRQGAVTVGITNFVDSPIGLESKYHLFTNAGLEKSVAATKTFTTQLFLLAHLVAELAKDSAMKEQLSLVPGMISKTLTLSDEIKGKVARYRFMNECFVLARGINYPVGLETALKIQETTYVRARAYATSDFYHGPFAMIEKDMPVFVLAPDGPTLKDTTDMIKKLKEREAELIVISNKDEVLELGNTAFKIPVTSNDMISPFYNAVVAQMFACQLALVRGLNPDSPRGLNKVTITK